MYATQSVDQILREFGVSRKGLNDAGVHRRVKEFGYNEIPEKKRSLILLFLKQFNSVLVYILLGALLFTIFLPFYENGGELTVVDFMDAIAIGVILILNAFLGFFQENEAENAISFLKQMSAPNVRARRNGKVQIIPSREIVPGDILLLEEGDRVSADGRILSARSVSVDEASLTGESKPSRKQVEVLKGNPGIADQSNMVFKGTIITTGHLEICVTSTGVCTELGKIAQLVAKVEHPPTPLEKSMMSLGRWLGLVVLVFCSIIFVAGTLRNLSVGDMLLAAASLAVSAVPEGLPAIVTVCLAIGVQRMIKRKVLTRELQAIETLGSITVICTDKTGTLTKNKMKVREMWSGKDFLPIDGGSDIEKETRQLMLTIAASCNNAHSLEVGDPTEIGLLEAAQKAGIKRHPIVEETVPFSSITMYMMTTHDVDGQKKECIKGAPERVLEICTHHLVDGKEEKLTAADRNLISKRNEEMAGRALRLLGFAHKKDRKTIFVGLIGMLDPPRDSVKSAIKRAKRAGIRTIMITGDHALTASAIGKIIGINGEVVKGDAIEKMSDEDLQDCVKKVSIFARVSPTHKVRILEALQSLGEIVAMGGDGVNDAPALKRAHVGFAMGMRGTDVARETAEIVLTDDHYESVVSAVEEGRTIYDNIRKFVVFLLRANFDELAVVFLAILFAIPLPYLPIHILLVNLMTDSLPAMALAMEKPEPNIMLRASVILPPSIFQPE